MRIEDLDPGRVREPFVLEHLRDLEALGLDWDEAPVRQTDRVPLYEAALAGLGEAVYPCWCSRAEVRAAGGHVRCRDRARTAAPPGRPPALRAAAEGVRVGFSDRRHGHVEVVLDDFVVRRADGAFAYNLATAVDDSAQGVTEVVRGDDLLATTPRQLWVLRALGRREPAYAHVPLMLRPDGQKLSKRLGDGDLLHGRDPAEVRAQLAASLRLCGPAERPSAADLLARFDPDGPLP